VAIVKVGYKRLYNSLGLSLPNDAPIDITVRLRDVEAHVYIGREPGLGISAATGSRYYILGREGSLGTMSFGRKDVSESHPIDLLTEISCATEVETTEETASGFQRDDQHAVQAVFALAESQSEIFRQTLDVIAGTIGLRLHPQFVIVILAENPIAFKQDGTLSQTLHGNVVQVLENLSLTDKAGENLSAMLQLIAAASSEAREFGASALGWLLRAWRESDTLSKFMSLFIPIEVILSAVKYDEAERAEQKRIDSEIEEILRAKGGAQAERFVDEYKKLRQLVHPPLAARFEHLARQAQIKGWEEDVAAFRRFNSIRNGVLHRGEQSVEILLPGADEMKRETISLEDLAERYVLWMLFRDKEPYRSRYRPAR
jgi:hypothetical protein